MQITNWGGVITGSSIILFMCIVLCIFAILERDE